jgi:hypothetical protein
MAKNVYCFYFTLTGAALELDLLGHAAIAASVLAIARIAAIVVGVFAGSRIATALARCEANAGAATPADGVGAGGTKYAWMAVLLCTVIFYANLAHSLTRSPSHI